MDKQGELKMCGSNGVRLETRDAPPASNTFTAIL